MTIQKTLSIIKPDAVQLGQQEKICHILHQAGLTSIANKITHLSRKDAEAFYADHKGKPFYEGLIEFMISGPIYIQVLEGENAVHTYRQLMGATDPAKAEAGTLRYEFGGKTLPANALHGSDSVESAKQEIAFFF